MIKWFEKNYVVSWMITIILAVVIFYVSSLTFQPSGGPLEIDLKPFLYHFLAFLFFSFFLFISLTRGKDKSLIALGIVIATAYAASDEIHQFFVPGRYCTTSDFFINMFGVAFATVFYLIYFEIKK